MLKNCLTCHLDLCKKNYTQFFYTIENFFLEEAIIHWKDTKACYYIQYLLLKVNSLFFEIVSFKKLYPLFNETIFC
jgi:hypothetical protein